MSHYPSRMSTFATMPPEMISSIAEFLPARDLANFRATCREIKEQTWLTFAQTAFTTRKHMLGRHSLQGLLAISQHDFGRLVKTLHLSTETVGQPKPFLRYPGTREKWEKQQYQERAVEALLADDAYCQKSGFSAALLAAALSNLRGVRSIEIGNFAGCSDDIPSYGTNYLFEATGLMPKPDAEICSSPETDKLSATFQSIMFALTTTQVPVQELNIRGVLHESALELPPPRLGQLPNALRSLKSLQLRLRTCWQYHPKSWHTNRSAMSSTLLSQFLATTPALEELLLVFFDDQSCLDPTTSRSFPSIAKTAELSRLRKLELSGLSTDENNLIEFLEAHKRTLKHVRFSGCKLREGNWRCVLEWMEKNLILVHFELRWPREAGQVVTRPVSICIEGAWDEAEDVCCVQTELAAKLEDMSFACMMDLFDRA